MMNVYCNCLSLKNLSVIFYSTYIPIKNFRFNLDYLFNNENFFLQIFSFIIHFREKRGILVV